MIVENARQLCHIHPLAHIAPCSIEPYGSQIRSATRKSWLAPFSCFKFRPARIAVMLHHANGSQIPHETPQKWLATPFRYIPGPARNARMLHANSGSHLLNVPNASWLAIHLCPISAMARITLMFQDTSGSQPPFVSSAGWLAPAPCDDKYVARTGPMLTLPRVGSHAHLVTLTQWLATNTCLAIGRPKHTVKHRFNTLNMTSTACPSTSPRTTSSGSGRCPGVRISSAPGRHHNPAP